MKVCLSTYDLLLPPGIKKLTLWCKLSENEQTHFKNLAEFTSRFWKCIWPFGTLCIKVITIFCKCFCSALHSDGVKFFWYIRRTYRNKIRRTYGVLTLCIWCFPINGPNNFVKVLVVWALSTVFVFCHAFSQSSLFCVIKKVR